MLKVYTLLKMIELASGFYKNYLISPEVSILIIGLDDSGKTTLLERLKVTEFTGIGSSTGNKIILSKPESQHGCHSIVSETSPEENGHSVSRRRRLLACPAPKLYRNTKVDDEDFQSTIDVTCGEKYHHDQQQQDMGSIRNCQTNGNSCTSTAKPILSGEKNQNIQYDMKKDKTMFPQHLIRPTVGMNLAKIEACNAKVKFYDLGGSSKMRPMWERYYNDVDAVVYVVDVSPMAKVTKLMESRAFYRCMRDDESMSKLPVLIFANKTDTRQSQCFDDSNENILNDTSLLDIAALFLSSPRGSSSDVSVASLTDHGDQDNVAIFSGSAKTGEGVRAAFEWIIQKGSDEVRGRGISS